MSKIKILVTEFGAVPDCGNVQTRAFQDAIDFCFKQGGGEVCVPTGAYIIGDIRLRSNITLHLMENARLLGSQNPEDYQNIYEDIIEPLPEEQATKVRWVYPAKWKEMGNGFKKHLYTAGSYWNYGIIRAVYAENIAIIGEEGAVIDGRNVYDPEGEENYRGPHAINMHFCENVKFEGYTVIDAGNWAHAIFQSKGVSFENLTVLKGHDALHTRACDDVLIKNCKLITGDDCIAGFNNNNVVIKDCEMSTACSAFRYGGNNILIENCKVYGPCQYPFRGSFQWKDKISGAETSVTARNNMLSFYTNFVTDDLPVKKKPGNITVKNCEVEGADRFLHLNLSGNEHWQRGNAPTDITFENIKANNIATGLYVYGNGSPLITLKLKDIESLIKAANFDKIIFENVKIENFKGEALVKSWTECGSIEIGNLDVFRKEYKDRVIATEKFECDII